MNSKLTIMVTCRNATVAKKLSLVLAPDNKPIPPGQRLSMSAASRLVTLRVESERALSGFNTARSVLRDVALFEEIWLISRGEGARERGVHDCST